MKPDLLFAEYRNGYEECLHHGLACVVGDRGTVRELGQRVNQDGSEWLCFYRSASKPIQALTVLVRGLHRRYGLTEEETAIFSGSHIADVEHVRVLESILEKTGLREMDMVMQPTYSYHTPRTHELIRQGKPPRKLYHNCSGKHLALMLLARELGDDVRDYWRRNSRAQAEVFDMIARMSGVPAERIAIGVDGCGVPVFAVPMEGIARAYLRLACPELIEDDALSRAVADNVARLHAYPNMIAGEGIVDSIITTDPDLIAKSGALGVYAIGVRSKRLGVAFKVADGSPEEFADIAVSVLNDLGVSPDTVGAIRSHYRDSIVNDTGEVVGRRETLFDLRLRDQGSDG